MEYELIITIVNTGFTDSVIEATRSCGATGGTILNGRGTAPKEAEEFFNLTISNDKEIVLTVVPKEIKDKCLKALYDKIGLASEGQGLSFSLPIEDAVGLKK